MFQFLLRGVLIAALSPSWSGGVAAASGKAVFSLELNQVETVASGCRITLVAHNGLEQDLTEIGVDLVVFDKEGAVAGYAAIDLGALPAAKTRVRQYDVFPRPCDNVARILLNDIRSCRGKAGVDVDCAPLLQPTSRTQIDFVR